MCGCPLPLVSSTPGRPCGTTRRQPRYADMPPLGGPALRRTGVVVRPLISGQAVPRSPAATPPRSSLRQGAHSHTGPGGQAPHCGATKKVTGGRCGHRRRPGRCDGRFPGGARGAETAHQVGRPPTTRPPDATRDPIRAGAAERNAAGRDGESAARRQAVPGEARLRITLELGYPFDSGAQCTVVRREVAERLRGHGPAWRCPTAVSVERRHSVRVPRHTNPDQERMRGARTPGGSRPVTATFPSIPDRQLRPPIAPQARARRRRSMNRAGRRAVSGWRGGFPRPLDRSCTTWFRCGQVGLRCAGGAAGLDRRAAALVLRDRAVQVSGVQSARVAVGRQKVKALARAHFRDLEEVRANLGARRSCPAALRASRSAGVAVAARLPRVRPGGPGWFAGADRKDDPRSTGCRSLSAGGESGADHGHGRFVGDGVHVDRFEHADFVALRGDDVAVAQLADIG